MYSGITRGLFPVIALDKQPGLLTYTVALNNELCADLQIGASMNIDGVCQSVVAIDNTNVTFQAMQETLNLTTLADLRLQQKVSVERSLRVGDEMGGHDVYGHVIGTATVIARQQSANNLSLTLQCPREWMRFILHKGFIALDGSSLTVGETSAEKGEFQIHLIPETLRVTNFAQRNIGDKINVEVDHNTQTIVETVEQIAREKWFSKD